MEMLNETQNIATDTRIIRAYIDYILENGKQPPSVYKFSSDLGIKEEEFYNYFGSFDGLEAKIWDGFIRRTIDKLKADESYLGFSIRERLLTFYYSFFEELKPDRSFVLISLKKHRDLEITPVFLREFRSTYMAYIDELVNIGKNSGEIAKRPLLDKRYARVFWHHITFLLRFWKDDNSAGFERTDAAIEKSVNLAFEFIGKGIFESAFDFAKFLYQSKTK